MHTYAKFENIEQEIKRILRNSKKSVFICVAWISHRVYGTLLRELISRGVKVEAICNDDQVNRDSIEYFSSFMSIYPVRYAWWSSFMHNKFCIIDGEILINGSYNWSKQATKSFENVTITRGDYNLVKQYLHEWHDIQEYQRNERYGYGQKCQDCHRLSNSRTYILGILGHEAGKYNESQVDVWELCVKVSHAHHLETRYEHHLHSYLGLDDENESEFENGECYDADSMFSDFYRERREMARLEQYFTKNLSIKIDAIGVVDLLNRHEHLEWGCWPEHGIRMIWRRLKFRKLVPDILYDDGEHISEIIHRHE